MQMLMDVELEVQVELGRKKIKIQDVMSLGKGSVLELDKNAGEPLELYINDTKLAEGEVVVVEDHFGIKITQLISPNERMKSLS
jgi:flagellar motor switch protein FliN/FliY